MTTDAMRELDIRLARAMGYRAAHTTQTERSLGYWRLIGPDGKTVGHPFFEYILDDGTGRFYVLEDGEDRLWREATPCFSADPHAMLTLMEWLSANGYPWTLEHRRAWQTQRHAEIVIAGRGFVVGDADTAPRALALAADAALRSTEEKQNA